MQHDDDASRDVHDLQRHEGMIQRNRISFEEFLSRYERDRAACDARYKEDREEAIRWRNNFDSKLAQIEMFIAEIRPTYKVGTYVVGSMVLGAFSIIFHLIWKKVNP